MAKLGSWQWCPETDTVTWSEELYRITGSDPNLPALSYKEHPTLFTVESWERLRGAVEDALRAGTPYELDLEMVRADGTKLWVIAPGEAQRDSTVASYSASLREGADGGRGTVTWIVVPHIGREKLRGRCPRSSSE